MALVPIVRNIDDARRAIQKLSQKLGPDATVYFNELHVTGQITAYEGRDVIRYALMMGLVTRRDH